MFEELSENEFIFNGTRYVAEMQTECSCDGCAFDCADDTPCLNAKCDSTERKDGRDVIFVEKQK